MKVHPHQATGMSGGEPRPAHALTIFKDLLAWASLWGDRDAERDQLSAVRVEMTPEASWDVTAGLLAHYPTTPALPHRSLHSPRGRSPADDWPIPQATAVRASEGTFGAPSTRCRMTRRDPSGSQRPKVPAPVCCVWLHHHRRSHAEGRREAGSPTPTLAN